MKAIDRSASNRVRALRAGEALDEGGLPCPKTTGEANDLEARFEHHPHMFAHMQPLGGNRFYVTFSDPELGKAVFPFTVQGSNVVGIRGKVDDDVEMDPYDFRKVQ